jgi:hypothetical protein
MDIVRPPLLLFSQGPIEHFCNWSAIETDIAGHRNNRQKLASTFKSSETEGKHAPDSARSQQPSARLRTAANAPRTVHISGSTDRRSYQGSAFGHEFAVLPPGAKIKGEGYENRHSTCELAGSD